MQYTSTDWSERWVVVKSSVVFLPYNLQYVESVSRCLILAVGCFCLVTQLLDVGCYQLSNNSAVDFERTWRIF